MVIPDVWTLIAVSTASGGWESVEGAVLKAAEARALCADGQILMAQKRLAPNRMGLLIKGRVDG